MLSLEDMGSGSLIDEIMNDKIAGKTSAGVLQCRATALAGELAAGTLADAQVEGAKICGIEGGGGFRVAERLTGVEDGASRGLAGSILSG